MSTAENAAPELDRVSIESARSEKISDLAAALAAAQGAFGPVPRDRTVSVSTRTGGAYTFKYAPLDTILGAVRQPLSANGFALSQDIIANGRRDYVRTTLYHTSGQWISNQVPVFASGDGAQAYGSGLTYARRYGVTLLLGIVADDDDDGNLADGRATQQRRPEPQRQPEAAPAGTGTTAEQMRAVYRTQIQKAACRVMGWTGDDLIAAVQSRFGRRFMELEHDEAHGFMREVEGISRLWGAAQNAVAEDMGENVEPAQLAEATRDRFRALAESENTVPLAVTRETWMRWIGKIKGGE